MADRKFHNSAGPFTVSQLSELAEVKIAGRVDTARRFSDVAPLESASETDVSFLDNPKYIEAFKRSAAGLCIVRPKFEADAQSGMTLFLTEEPYFVYAKIASAFYPSVKTTKKISEDAYIAKTAKIGNGVEVEAGAVIKENAVVGDNTKISANVVIDEEVSIGNNCYIGPNVSIGYAIVGDRVIIHPGARIGQDGFGFAPSMSGLFKVPQLGRVIIENDVEIGANTCIDRGSGPDTIIGAGTKIDNLVQIGHNVRIGKCCIIVAQVGISGSTQIGDGAVIGGQVGIVGHVKIGSGSKIAAQSGVVTDVPQGQSFGGYPAVPVKEWHRQSVVLKRMTRKNKVFESD